MSKQAIIKLFYLMIVLCHFCSTLTANGLSANDIEQRLKEIDEQLLSLPNRPAYPVGGRRGYKWSKDTKAPWVELQFPKIETVDSLAIVPLATFHAGKVNAYTLPPKIRVTILGSDKIVFEGSTLKVCEAATPLYVELKSPIKATGLKLEILSNQTSDAYLSISEIFVFSNGTNIALGSKVSGNNDENENPISNAPKNLIDGQSSLGQPIIKNLEHNPQAGFSTTFLKQTKPFIIEFTLPTAQQIHEVRLFPLYAPRNEMILEAYGLGFPVSFQLESLNENEETLHIFHKGQFITPHRNLTIFQGSSHKVKKIKLTIDEPSKKSHSKKHFFSLSEIQIFNTNNENLAPLSSLSISGIDTSSSKEDNNWPGHLTDNKTSKGSILDLETWIKKLALRNTLIHERQDLLHLQSDMLAHRTRLVQIILFLFGSIVLIMFYTWFKSKERQKQRLNLIRKDIANDLHDEIGSNLASIRLISRRLSNDKGVETIRDILDESEEALREMVWALSPQQIPLISKLKESIDRLLGDHNVGFNIQTSPIWEQLHLKDRQNVLFWFKEALHNIQKHAQANSVSIELKGSSLSEPLLIEIFDDGIGMDLKPHTNNYDHLARLKARALKLSGEFNVDSEPGKGCKVSLSFKPQQKT